MTLVDSLVLLGMVVVCLLSECSLRHNEGKSINKHSMSNGEGIVKLLVVVGLIVEILSGE